MIGPLYRPGLPRRRSSDIDLKETNKPVSKDLINFNDSAQKIQQEKLPQGSVTARVETGEAILSKGDIEKSAETIEKTQNNDDSKMLMNHDESV